MRIRTFTRWFFADRRAAARRRRLASGAVIALATLLASTTAFAQLDPLLFLKRVPPTVIIVVDTSLRMLEDGNGNFYDPNFYTVSDDAAVMSAFPTVSGVKTYRRVYQNLQYAAAPGKYTATSIAAQGAVWNPANPLTFNAPSDVAFLDPTRYAMARRGIASAVADNASSSYRWGLIRLRQSTPAWRSSPACDKPVLVADATQALYGDTTPCNAGGLANYAIYAPSVAAASYAQGAAPAGTVMVAPAVNTAASIVALVNRGPNDPAALIPAGIGGVGYEDRPITYALVDAKAAASAAMAADTASCRTCRNTVVILITGGKDDGDAAYRAANNPLTTASQFLTVSGGGTSARVPIMVVAIKPAAGDVAQLQSIASNSSGRYFSASSAADVTTAINYAVQAGFTRSTDFQTSSSSDFLPVSPIVGSVNLKNASDATGASLPNTDIVSSPGSIALPQRSNVMITAGFSLPGFDGLLRAFRVYKPVADSTKPIGYKFVNDGTRLWPDLDGRPSLAGKARIPSDPNTRNIYTYIPDGAGGGSVIPFTTMNTGTLSTHMGVTGGIATAAIINAVRARPIGAIIGSTPALMDPPSLDPPPDDDYGRSDGGTTFAGTHKDRRAIIFVGANDGMIHAIDARTGYEVWAFIPYNLLPKLRALSDGQPVDQFDYFVDSSPKIAEVKIKDAWRSLLIIGEGPGGIFYQAFDVTEAGMGVDPDMGDLSAVNALLARFDTPDESIQFKWAFPNYSNFDPTYTGTFSVTDGTPGGRVKLYGDLKAGAPYAEQTVGFTWSDPAVGALDAARDTTAVIMGSGYFPDIESLIPNRGASAPKAGNAIYLLDVDTGQLLGNEAATTCSTISSGMGSGRGCVSIGDVAGNGRKNALQADPTAAANVGEFAVNKAYLGDLDGKYWRFNFTSAGVITASLMLDTLQPIYASSALLFVGTTDIYMFFATGSDLLPASTSGGTGTFKMFGLKDNYPGSGATQKFSNDLPKVTISGGFTDGQRPSTSPTVAGDIVFYTATAEDALAPCTDFSSKLYAMTFQGGSAYTELGGSAPKRAVASVAGRASAPFIVDQHLYLATSANGGAAIEAFGDAEDFNNGIGQVGVRILSWRDIR
jgi:PQQ enzyme repeat